MNNIHSRIIDWDGKPVSSDGCYRNIPIDLYHGAITDGYSMSSSGIRTVFTDSPLDYWFYSPYNPDKLKKESSKTFDFGKAVHHRVLGEADFDGHFVVAPESYSDEKTGEIKKWNGNSLYCKNWLLTEKSGKNRIILSSNDVQNILGCAGLLHIQKGIEDSGLLNNKTVVQGDLLTGLVEHSLIWKDKKTGIWLKSRPDVIPTGDNIHVDLKTTSSAKWRDVESSLYKFGYLMQAALCRRAHRAIFDKDLDCFCFVFVESSAPWATLVVEIRPNDMDEADKNLQAAIETSARCFETGKWPSQAGSQSSGSFIGLSEWQLNTSQLRRDFLQRELQEEIAT